MTKTDLDRQITKHNEALVAIIREGARWQLLGFTIVFGLAMGPAGRVGAAGASSHASSVLGLGALRARIGAALA